MFSLFIFCLVAAAVEFMLVIDLKPKAEIPLYVVVIALLMLFVPGLNIIEIVILGIVLTMACHNGYDLAGSNPVSKFFKMLNRNI